MKALVIVPVTLLAGTVALVGFGLRQLSIWFTEATELGIEDLS